MPAAAQLRSPAPLAPRRSPERQRLAEAISRHHAPVGELQRIQEAEGRHMALRRQEWAAVETAERLLAAAKTAEPGRAASLLLGEEVAGPSVADAEASLTAARQAEQEGARRGQALRQRQHDVEGEVERSRQAIADAKSGVVAPSAVVAMLAEEYGKHRARLAVLDAVFKQLGSSMVLPAEVHRAVFYVYSPTGAEEAEIKAEVARWHGVLAGLSVDADTPLPSGDDVDPAAAA